MRLIISFIVLMFVLSGTISAQDKKAQNIKEGAPKAKIYNVATDSVLKFLQKDKENKIRIVLEGPIKTVNHEVIVTSNDAIIKRDPVKEDVYIVIPQHETCEIIVDVETFAVFYAKGYKTVGAKKKYGLVPYPADKYMVAYEKYEVK